MTDRKRILIVDDEAPLRFLLSKQLARAGFETATAADGRAALAALAEGVFDAVVLDVVMPGLDGYEVCRRLKADPRTDALPVVFLSASCNGDFRRRAFELGAADFLAKPFQTELLPAYLHALLDGAQPATQGNHVVCVAGTHRRAGSAAAAVRLAERRALTCGRPVMLIDLELPAGSIGAQLQLSGGPNVRLLLQDTGEAVAIEAIGRVSQRVHFGLQVIPAPFAPSPLGHAAPDAARLGQTINVLLAAGYDVVLHVGATDGDVATAALGAAAEAYAVGLDDEAAEAWLGRWAAAGVARGRWTWLDAAVGRGTGEARPAVRADARPSYAARPVEAMGQLATA